MRNLLLLPFLFIILLTGSLANHASTHEQAPAEPNLVKKAKPTINNLHLEKLIADNTQSVLLLQNTPKFYASWKKSPLLKLWENKKIRKNFAASIRSLEQPRWEIYSQRYFGLSINKLMALFTGQMVIFLPEFSQPDSLSLMADIGENQTAIKKALTTQLNYQLKKLGEGEQYLQEDETFLSDTVHTLYFLNEESKTEHFSWAMHEHYLLLAKSKINLSNMLTKLQQKNLDNNWTETSSYQNVSSSQPEFDWLFYVNNAPLMDLLNTKLQVYQDITDDESQPFFELLNNTGLESLYILGKDQKNKSLLDMTLFYSDNSWLMSLFKHQSSELKWPAFLQKTALSASTSSINLGQIWKNVLMLPDHSPVFASFIPLIQMQLQSYSQSSGVNLENALVDGFGQEVYSAFYPLAEPLAKPDIKNGSGQENEEQADENEIAGNNLYVISLQDQQAVEMAINGLQKAFLMSDLFEKKRYLDTNIYFYNASATKNIHQAKELMVYAISDDLLFYSNNLAVMENAIEQLRNKNKQHSIQSLEKVKQIMQQLPGNATDVSYYQGAYFTHNLTNLLLGIQEMTTQSEQYSCGGNSNDYSEDDKAENNGENKIASTNSLKSYEGYIQSVLMSQHQADNYYRIHSHINY